MDGWVDIGVKPLPICSVRSVAFRTAAEGWVIDECGHVLVTRNAGRSFEFLDRHNAPFVAAGAPDEKTLQQPSDRGVTQLTWVTAKRGIAFGWHASFVTNDGGAHWSPLATAPTAPVLAIANHGNDWWACTTHGIVRSTDGGTTWSAMPQPFVHLCRSVAFADGLLVAGDHDGRAFSWSDLTQEWTKTALMGDTNSEARWGNGRIVYDSRVLTFLQGGVVAQRLVVRGHGSNEKERIVGIARRDVNGDAVAWTKHAVLASLDGGITWETRKIFAEPITHVSADGHDLRVIGNGWKDDWWHGDSRGSAELSERDVTGWVAQGDPTRAREINPLRCLASASTAKLTVHKSGDGYHYRSAEWELSTYSAGATLRRPENEYVLNVQQFTTLLNTIAASLEKRPTRYGYHTSAVTLRWWCDDGRVHRAYLPEYGEIVSALEAMSGGTQ